MLQNIDVCNEEPTGECTDPPDKQEKIIDCIASIFASGNPDIFMTIREREDIFKKITVFDLLINASIIKRVRQKSKHFSYHITEPAKAIITAITSIIMKNGSVHIDKRDTQSLIANLLNNSLLVVATAYENDRDTKKSNGKDSNTDRLMHIITEESIENLCRMPTELIESIIKHAPAVLFCEVKDGCCVGDELKKFGSKGTRKLIIENEEEIIKNITNYPLLKTFTSEVIVEQAIKTGRISKPL